MNFLSTYWDYSIIEFDTKNSFQFSDYAINLKYDNFIPAFQSEFKYSVADFGNISKIELIQLQRANFYNIVSTSEIELTKIELITKIVNGVNLVAVSLPQKEYCTDITTKEGVYFLKVTSDNNKELYTDLFYLNGAPVAVYECSDADFDYENQEFSIKITRTDADDRAFNENELVVRFFNSVTNTIVNFVVTNLAFEIAEFQTFTFDATTLNNGFNTINWGGACTGSLDLYITFDSDIYFFDTNIFSFDNELI